MKLFPRGGSLGLLAFSLLGACSGGSPAGPPGSTSDPLWCGRGTDVMGAQAASGFCIKSYAQIGEARSLAVAPNGDLFVAAPSDPTPGGASNGPGAIFVLSDDNRDGVAEPHVFLSRIDADTKLTDVHGLALGGGYLYFTTKFTVWRTPYADGQRKATGTPESLNLPALYGMGGRWTHGLARSVQGQLVTSRASYATCTQNPGGEISTIGPTGALTVMAAGFRNPMYLRCHQTDEVCAAMELGEDQLTGAREKMVILHPNTDYGYPCCITQATTVPSAPTAACGEVAKEDASFPLSDTPFGFDWERGFWPEPFHNGVFVALHGSAYAPTPWAGASIVYAPTDATTHAPVQDWVTFQGGFGFGGSILDRPSDLTFGPDGRMFISDDASGNIYWMAPTTLAVPPR